MQDYTYSVFSIVAIAIHLMMNFNLLRGRLSRSVRAMHYRDFLWGVLAYYVADAAWGVLAGLDWTRALYVDTLFYFLSLVAFVVLLSRFVATYVNLGKRTARFLSWYGYALIAFNVISLVANVCNNCFFYFDENGRYFIGDQRRLAFFFQIAYTFLIALAVLAKALAAKDAVRRRGIMVFFFCVTIAVANILQVVLPLTPFTSLGCLISSCFFNVFVVQDELMESHMIRLENALARARAAEKSRSMFFSIVSHDIRTPLNAILGYSDLLQYGIKNKSGRDEALNSIRASGTTLLQLVNDVLDLAKMDAGKITLNPPPVLLYRLTNDVFASFKMVSEEKRIALQNRTAAVPAILVDEHRFRQILFNLVGNAVKFTSSGHVSVDASYADSTLTVSVADTGCGIAPDMLNRVLDPFFQVQDPSHAPDRMGGTGLGLSICNRLVKTMGGKFTVESELGKGSTFTARIPGVEAAKVKIAPVATRRHFEYGGQLPKRVLVVDDSSLNRAVITALLKEAGIPYVGNACDGVEALAELDSALKSGNPYEFVFSDFWMPNMNGLEFIEKLRADRRFKNLDVFAVTADTEFRNDDRHKLFNGVLLKPITFTALVGSFCGA